MGPRHRIRNLFLALGALVVVVALMFGSELRRARSIVVQSTPEPLISTDSYIIDIQTADPLLGNPGAPLTLVFFADLEDAASAKIYKTLSTFVNEHPKDARLVWKDFPNKHLFQADATPLHIAAWCANQQNKFWQFVDTAYKNNPKNTSAIQATASEVGLDMIAWQNCLVTTPPADHIAASTVSGGHAGVGTAPALFVNNKRISLKSDVDIGQMLGTFITP